MNSKFKVGEVVKIKCDWPNWHGKVRRIFTVNMYEIVPTKDNEDAFWAKNGEFEEESLEKLKGE